MKYDPQKHHRRSIRLKGYDYHNAGAYFVTICTMDRECLLNDPIVNGIIDDVWLALTSWFPTVILDEFVVMPNHIHFILWLIDPVGVSLANTQSLADTRIVKDKNRTGENRTGASPAPTGWVVPKPEKINTAPALGDVVGAFKSLVFKVYLDWIEIHDPSRRAKFWQRNYYEHIVRNERELNAIRQYIIDNPKNWKMDRDNLENLGKLPPPEKVEDYLTDIENILRVTR
jgi:REP element-mobilizing transposase RayT